MQRLIPLEGGRNFRDLGGYPAADGRSVRWRLIYRSGIMSQLTGADCAHLATLGIRVVCDFRTVREREQTKSRWQPDGVEQLHWSFDAARFGLQGLLQDMDPSCANMERAMIRLYDALPTEFAECYRAIFARLVAADVPMVICCSAGKDRTGLAAALILTSLGVSWEHVLEDYELTNTLVDLERAYFANPGARAGLDDMHRSFAALPSAVRAPMFKASPVYLSAAFRAIERDHGSFRAYLGSLLGVSDLQLERMRDNLLEHARRFSTN